MSHQLDTPSTSATETSTLFVSEDLGALASDELPWKIPTVQELWSNRSHLFGEDQRTEAWGRAADVIKGYSDEMVKRWNAEIDTLLVYAGLFSAILTAFNVQSYPLLQNVPQDPILIALERISQQLGSFSDGSQFVNSTTPALTPTSASAQPPARSAIWLNIFWFSSLICSLSAASIGIMVKQWLNEYSAGLSGASREIARLRQHRLDGLKRWRVAEIVSTLPILLQLALALFFAGLLVLLWTLHPAVAGVASALIGALSLFTGMTTVLPCFRPDCSYLSPLSLGLFLLSQKARHVLNRLHGPVSRAIGSLTWSRRAPFLQRPSLRANLLRLEHLMDALLCHPRSSLSWRGREHRTLRVAGERLDVAMLAAAYSTTFSLPFLASTALACTADLRAESVLEVFDAVHALNVRHWGPHHDAGRRLEGNVWAGVLLALMTIPPHLRSTEWTRRVGDVERYLCLAGAGDDVGRSDALLATLARAALQHEELGHDDMAFRVLAQVLIWSDIGQVKLGESVRFVAAAAEQRLLAQVETIESGSDPDNQSKKATVASYLATLHVLLLTIIRATPTTVMPEDDSLIRASAQRALRLLASLLVACPWDTDAYAQQLHDVNGLLLDDFGENRGRRRIKAKIIPDEFVKVMQTQVLGSLKAEADASGEMFWWSKFEDRISELVEKVYSEVEQCDPST